MPSPRDHADLTPLPLATFHILLSLAEGDRHGYAIMQEVEKRTAGRLRLSAGTLYRSVQRMVGQGLIEETRRRPPAGEDDERRRYYAITSLGRSVAREEVARLADLVSLGRAAGFTPGSA